MMYAITMRQHYGNGNTMGLSMFATRVYVVVKACADKASSHPKSFDGPGAEFARRQARPAQGARMRKAMQFLRLPFLHQLCQPVELPSEPSTPANARASTIVETSSIRMNISIAMLRSTMISIIPLIDKRVIELCSYLLGAHV